MISWFTVIIIGEGNEEREALNSHGGVEDGGFGTPARSQKGEEREGGMEVERPEPDVDSKGFGRGRCQNSPKGLPG